MDGNQSRSKRKVFCILYFIVHVLGHTFKSRSESRNLRSRAFISIVSRLNKWTEMMNQTQKHENLFSKNLKKEQKVIFQGEDV